MSTVKNDWNTQQSLFLHRKNIHVYVYPPVINAQGITSNSKNVKRVRKITLSQEIYHLAETIDIYHRK